MGFSQFLAVLPLASAVVVQPLVIREDALGPAAEVVATPNSQLFEYETVQLTDKVLDELKDQVPDVSIFSFQQDASASGKRDAAKLKQKKCKTYPGDSLWPSQTVWNVFDLLLGGALIKSTPEPSICYPSWGTPNAAKCADLTATWNNSTLRIENPISIRSILFQGMTCMPPNYTASFLGNTGTCTLGGFPEYSVNVTQVYQAQLAVNLARELDLRLVIKNTGHDFGAKSTGHGALNIWTHNLKEAHYYPTYTAGSYKGPAVKFGAGIQVFEANRFAKKNGITVIGGEGRTVGMVGGYTQGGGHSPLSSIYGMAADQVLSIQLVTADGRFITADENNHKDIFWAVRGGGGSTFGVVTSMVYKAFPKIRTTIMTYNMTTGPNFTHETFWKAQKAYLDEFERLADLGFYAYYRIRHVNGEIVHDVTSMVAPNKTEAEFRAIMAPLWAKWAALGVPFNPSRIQEYDDYNDAFVDAFPQEAWTWTMRQASRLIPRKNIVDPTQRQAMFDALRNVFDGGANLILFNIRNPPGSASIDNAVNPAWRDVLMFALMFVTWDVKAAPEYVTELSRNLTYTWNPTWRALTPGSGTYMSESDYIEPNFQQSFFGNKYARLYDIKQKVDPRGVFYAQNAVGSEDWQMGELLMGHLPSQNSKLCRK